MTEQLTKDQFNVAVSDAVAGILNVYREVAAMFRELSSALGAAEPRLAPLMKRALVPGAHSKNPDARYLRSYHAYVYALSNDADDDDDEEEDDDADDEDREVDRKSPLAIKIGDPLVMVRATIFDQSSASFEPNVVVGTLLRCRVDSNVTEGELKIGPGRLRKVLRAIDSHRVSSKPVQTNIPVTVGNQKNNRLVFDMPKPWTRHALFDMTPTAVQEIAKAVRSELAPRSP